MATLPALFVETPARPPLHVDPHPQFDPLRPMHVPRLATGEIVLGAGSC